MRSCGVGWGETTYSTLVSQHGEDGLLTLVAQQSTIRDPEKDAEEALDRAGLFAGLIFGFLTGVGAGISAYKNAGFVASICALLLYGGMCCLWGAGCANFMRAMGGACLAQVNHRLGQVVGIVLALLLAISLGLGSIDRAIRTPAQPVSGFWEWLFS